MRSGEERLRLPGRLAAMRLGRRDREPVAPAATSADPLPAWADRVRWLLRDGAGVAFLDGAPTPAGGGLVLAALEYLIEWDESTAGVVDSWITAFGPAFTAAAVAESGAVEVRRTLAGVLVGETISLYRTGRLSQAQVRLRAAIAVAGDAEREVAEAALADVRAAGSLWHRVSASFMAPHRADWVDADCAEAVAAGAHGAAEALSAAISTAAQLDTLMPLLERAAVRHDPVLLATFADGLGAAAAAPIADWWDRDRTDRGRSVRRDLLAVLAAIPGDEAFRLLLARAGRPEVAAALAKVAARAPRRALRLLATEGTSGEATALLRARVAADPELAAEVAATLPAEAAARIRPRESVDVLPPLALSAPPERAAGEGAASGAVRSVTAGPGTLESGPEETGAVGSGAVGSGAVGSRVVGVAPSAGERWLPGERKAWAALAPVEIGRSHLVEWEPPRGARSDLEQAVVARFGLEALPMALRLAGRQPDTMGVLLMPFHGPEVAAMVAGWLEHAGSARMWARLWLERHAEPAARALGPVAAGKPSTARDQARRALRLLDALAAGRPVASGRSRPDAATVPPPVEERARAGAMPLWAVPEALPPIRLRGGGELPDASVATLLAALSWTRYDALPWPPPGSYDPATGRAETVESAFAPQPLIARDTPGAPVIAAARELCEPASLAGFGQALLDRWVAAKLPAAESWLLLAQAHLADEAAVERLVTLIRPWPGRGRHVRAGDGVAVLGTLAAESVGAALFALERLTAEQAPTLRERATAYLDTAAAVHGLTRSQVPNRAVADPGRIELSYGARRVIAGVGEQLEPYVLDPADGRRMRTLPRPSARDDAAAVAVARERFARLRRELRPEADRQAKRLESAMINGVRWPAAELTGHLFRHTLLGPFTRRLLWACYGPDGHPLAVVRVCEDGSLADVDDRPATLDPGAPVGVAHPADLGDGDSPARWAALFADYGIGQPFAQLGRPRFPVTPAERDATVLVRGVAADLNPSRLGRFVRRGWRSAPGGLGRFAHDVPGTGLVLSAAIEDGRVRLTADERGTLHWGRPPWLPIGAVPPAAVEEAIRDLTLLCSA